ncbi:hypothetical protein [Corallococcus sp. AB011P]|uniref:hypothetical protein n=1 Tax=Corallococcus sp. AB011P TaxID=2316735 RepID=UPI0011C36CF4|nr:hypothetical protein [Corallococcus sp. AB011P]
MSEDLDQSMPLVLLIGVESEGIVSTLKTAGRQYKIKKLDSGSENWDSIVAYLDRFDVRCVLVKLNGRVYDLLVHPDYESARERLLDRLARLPHAIFVYEELLFDSPPKQPELLEDDENAYFWLSFHRPKEDVRKTVNALLSNRGLNVLPYRRNAELTVMAAKFVEDAEHGLIFRLYIPTGRLWAHEIDRLLQLFRDYLSRVDHLSVRLDQRRTGSGTVFEFFAAPDDQKLLVKGKSTLDVRFQEFSEFLDLCASDVTQAENLLRAKQVDPQEVVAIVSRYSKELKRLQIDLRHDRELKVLSIRQRLEAELSEVLPINTTLDDLSRLADMAVPSISGVGSALSSEPRLLQVNAAGGSNVTINYSPQAIAAVNAVVAREIHGDVHLNEMDRKLLDLIEMHASTDKPALTSAVRELADASTPQADRLTAGKRLLRFVLQVGSKAADKMVDLGVGILQTYLEKKLGL